MDGITELAKLLKGDTSLQSMNVTTGTVVSRSPIQIRINDVIVLDREDVMMTARYAEREHVVGEQVLIFISADGQSYYIIDKVVRI